MTETKGKAAQALRKSRSGPSAGPRRLELALQGGGAHGAFTWGVLDRLLEETGIEIVALSGSRRTESYWTRTFVHRPGESKVIATMLLNQATLKESYVPYEDEKARLYSGN